MQKDIRFCTRCRKRVADILSFVPATLELNFVKMKLTSVQIDDYHHSRITFW